MIEETRLGQFLKVLDETQYLPPERLKAYQRRLLTRLLNHARAETDFYADRLAPAFRHDGTIDWDRWQDIPILTRAEAQANGAAITARTVPAQVGESEITFSSGSTAEPFRYSFTEMQALASFAANERVFDWHNIEPAALLAAIWAMDFPERGQYPQGSPEKPWRPNHPESRSVNLMISTPIDKQVEWLRRVDATYLASYPTNMREIGRHADEMGASLRFAAILTNAEMIHPDTREALRTYFGREPIDRYGATEIGLIAATCPHSFRHHINAELFLMEIIRPDGSPAAAGENGRIVVTPFYAYAMPLIRYDTGDWAAFAAEPCGCGRTLPLLERICGRSRNMFRFPDGARVMPLLESRRISAFVPHRQYQVVQTGPYEIEYRYVPLDPALPIDRDGLTAFARSQLHPKVNITPVAVDHIARASNGKHEDYISLIS